MAHHCLICDTIIDLNSGDPASYGVFSSFTLPYSNVTIKQKVLDIMCLTIENHQMIHELVCATCFKVFSDIDEYEFRSKAAKKHVQEVYGQTLKKREKQQTSYESVVMFPNVSTVFQNNHVQPLRDEDSVSPAVSFLINPTY